MWEEDSLFFSAKKGDEKLIVRKTKMSEQSIVGKNLRAYRQLKGLKQKELAAAVGLSVDTICKVELGKQENIGLKYLTLFCRELDISIEELFLENPKSLKVELVASEKNIEALKKICKKFFKE